jgi:hypothetical protein
MNAPSEFYTGTVSELLNDDVPLVPRLEKRAEQLIEDDPLAVDERHEHNDGGGNNVGSFKEMSRFHPFMRLFNVCARSMYLDEPKGRRMRLFSLRHPLFRRSCLIGDFIFTSLCSILIILALTYILGKLSGFSFPWDV